MHNKTSDNNKLNQKHFTTKQNSIINLNSVYLSCFYLVLLVLNHFLNPYSNITIPEIFVFVIICLIINLIYSAILRFIINKTYNNNHKKEKQASFCHICLHQGILLLNITVTILFIGILVTFTFNLYAGFSLMGIALVTAIGGLAYITYKEISAKSSKIMLCILFILVTILNPSFMLGVIPLRTEILDLYYVDNKEMQPTLQPGSFLLIDKISGLLRSPTLQDIILTRSPANKTKINLITKVFRHFKSTPNSFIRRVIGTPGDRIRVNNDNRVFLNNNFLSEPFIRKSKNYQLCDYVYYCNIEKVPASHFYLLGDNRAATQDSRIWSTVDKRLFQGKIFAILWPRNKTKTFP